MPVAGATSEARAPPRLVTRAETRRGHALRGGSSLSHARTHFSLTYPSPLFCTPIYNLQVARSLAEEVALLPPDEQEEVLASLDPEALKYDANFWLRPEQLEPDDPDWAIWLYMAGRGSGKTRAAAEWIRKYARYTHPQGPLRFALVARTASDVRDTLVQGDSGILSITPPSEMPVYQPSLRKLTWPNGNFALCYCATPDTEALTRDRGWVTHDQLSPGDVILTLNTCSGLSEWQPVQGVHRFEVKDEPLAEIKGRFHSSRTTAAHRWPVYDREGRLRWTTTRDIYEGRAGTKSRIIGAAPNADLPREAKYQDALVELAAWFMCEGTVSKTATRPSISISQSEKINPTHCANITRALTDLFGPPREHLVKTGRRIEGLSWRHVSPARGRTVRAWHVDPDAAQVILSVFEPDERHRKVPTREFILSLTRAQLELFVARCVDADGYRKNSAPEVNYSLGQSHPGRDDRFALALTLLGVPYAQFHPAPGFWSTTTRRSPGVPLTPRIRDQIEVSSYTGTVWCPTTPNSTWFARRDGKTYFTGNTADEPDQLRGPQFHYAWADEAAAWRQLPDASGMTAWANLRVATRLPHSSTPPRIVVTTTPKRVQLMRDLLSEANRPNSSIRITRGSTRDNIGNLDPAQVDALYGNFAGTRMQRQELEGEMLDDADGALWTYSMIEDFRASSIGIKTPLRLVGVDPTVAETPGDECGIVVVASTSDRELFRRQAFVLEDTTVKGSPEHWAQRVVDTARKWRAPVVAETNQGGALVRHAISAIDPSIPVYEVHSRHGKKLRAEPVALAYEQGRVHHLGTLAELETQMTQWLPEETRKSPDRVDALVHALTALIIAPPKGFYSGPIRASSPARARIPSSRLTSRGRSSLSSRSTRPGGARVYMPRPGQ